MGKQNRLKLHSSKKDKKKYFLRTLRSLISINPIGNSKCFTYVTKTIANLTTFSRKPGDYNGTIIFEIDIMKKSSPLNLIFTFFAMSKPK